MRIAHLYETNIQDREEALKEAFRMHMKREKLKEKLTKRQRAGFKPRKET